MKPIARITLLSLTVLVLVLATAPAMAQTTPADAFWESKYYHAGIQGTVHAMLSQPGALIVGGYLSSYEDMAINNVVRLETSAGVVTGATALGDGLDDRVSDFCEYGGQVVAGGYFDRSGDTVLNGVAAWDGAAWQPLGEGIPGAFVKTVAEYGGLLFAGAYAWDGVSWTNVLQTDAGITELVVQDGLMFVGGNFTEARGVPVDKVFAWDGVDVIPLGAGFPEDVISATASPDGPIFATDSYESYGKVYRWDGAAWIVERENTIPHAVGYFDGELIVSNSIYVSPHNYMPATQSNGTGPWVTLGSFTSRVMCEHDGVLFLQADPGDQTGVLTPGLVAYDGLALQEAFPPGNGFSVGFITLAPFGTGVMAGGYFAMADGHEFDGAGLGAGGTWSPWGDRSGLPTGTGQGPFQDLAVLGSDVFGIYSFYDWDISVEVLVKSVWSGTEWEWQIPPLAGSVYGDLVATDSYLFLVQFQGPSYVEPVTGYMTPVPGLDLDGGVRGSCAHQDELVICGEFTTNFGVPVSNVLRFSEDTWQDVGDPLSCEQVVAVAPMEGAQMAAALRMGYSEYQVALFDGTDWTVLDGVFDYGVTHLQYHRGQLFVAGGFSIVGTTPVDGIAVWTGTKWVAVGRGLAGGYNWSRVTDMVSSGDSLWLAGSFTTAGGHPSVGLAEWTGDPAMLTGEPSGVAEDLPTRAGLLGAPYPNPFNPMTTVTFAIPRDGHVRVAVYDVRGKLVRLLADEALEAGTHEATWDGRDEAGRVQPAGVYFARMVSDGIHEAVKLTLVK